MVTSDSAVFSTTRLPTKVTQLQTLLPGDDDNDVIVSLQFPSKGGQMKSLLPDDDGLNDDVEEEISDLQAQFRVARKLKAFRPLPSNEDNDEEEDDNAIPASQPQFPSKSKLRKFKALLGDGRIPASPSLAILNEQASMQSPVFTTSHHGDATSHGDVISHHGDVTSRHSDVNSHHGDIAEGLNGDTYHKVKKRGDTLGSQSKEKERRQDDKTKSQLDGGDVKGYDGNGTTHGVANTAVATAAATSTAAAVTTSTVTATAVTPKIPNSSRAASATNNATTSTLTPTSTSVRKATTAATTTGTTPKFPSSRAASDTNNPNTTTTLPPTPSARNAIPSLNSTTTTTPGDQSPALFDELPRGDGTGDGDGDELPHCDDNGDGGDVSSRSYCSATPVRNLGQTMKGKADKMKKNCGRILQDNESSSMDTLPDLYAAVDKCLDNKGNNSSTVSHNKGNNFSPVSHKRNNSSTTIHQDGDFVRPAASKRSTESQSSQNVHPVEKRRLFKAGGKKDGDTTTRRSVSADDTVDPALLGEILVFLMLLLK
jgi:hypothetical protein